MKRKILVFLAAILCITALLVSCGGDCATHLDENADGKCDNCEADVTVCTAHTDADDNNYCDTCKKAVVKLEVPTDIADLVVKPLPEGGALTDYVLTDYQSNTYVLAAATEIPVDGTVIDSYYAVLGNCDHDLDLNEDNQCDVCNRLIVFTNDERAVVAVKSTATAGEGADAVTTVTYTVYDILAGKALYTYSYTEKTNVQVDVYISLENFGYTVSIHTKTTTPAVAPATEDTVAHQYDAAIYTYAATSIYSYSGTEEPGELDFSFPDAAESNIFYVEIDGTTYAIDEATGAVITSGRSDIFVKRPAFDKIVGNYGFVMNGSTPISVSSVYVYDLTKWIECVYVYEVPANQTVNQVFQLDNGNMLVQSLAMLDQNARKYDILMSGAKMNITYTYVDVAAKTAAEVDFGYLIADCQNGEAVDVLWNDSVQNIMTVAPIANGAVDTNNTIALVIDNDLTIKYAFDPTPIFAQQGPLFIVGDNRYFTYFKYGSDDDYTWAVVDENLEIINYLPTDYLMVDGEGNPINESIAYTAHIYRDGFIVVDGTKVYNLDMTFKMELGKDYDLVRDCGSFFILSKTVVTEDDPDTTDVDEYKSVTTYYFYDPAQGNPVALAATSEIVAYDHFNTYFVVKNTIAGADGEPDTYTYDVINNDNVKVVSGLTVEPSIQHSAGRSYITVTAGEDKYLIKTTLLGQ